MATAPAPSQQEITKFSQICEKCKVPTAIIETWQGDLVCRDADWCSSRASSTRSSEWRTFSDSDKGGADPSRTARPHEPHAERRRARHVHRQEPRRDVQSDPHPAAGNSGRNPDRHVLAAFGKINELADHLGMTNVVKDGACDIFRMVVKPGQPMLGKSLNAMYAACLYMLAAKEGARETHVQGDLRGHAAPHVKDKRRSTSTWSRRSTG